MVAIVYKIAGGKINLERFLVDYILVSLSVMVFVVVWWGFLALKS